MFTYSHSGHGQRKITQLSFTHKKKLKHSSYSHPCLRVKERQKNRLGIVYFNLSTSVIRNNSQPGAGVTQEQQE